MLIGSCLWVAKYGYFLVNCSFKGEGSAALWPLYKFAGLDTKWHFNAGFTFFCCRAGKAAHVTEDPSRGWLVSAMQVSLCKYLKKFDTFDITYINIAEWIGTTTLKVNRFQTPTVQSSWQNVDFFFFFFQILVTNMLTLCWLKGKMQRLTKCRHDSSWSQCQRVQRIREFWASEDRVSRKDGGVSQEEQKCTLRDCFKIAPTPASTLSTWKHNPCTTTAAEQWHRMWIKSSGGPLLRAFHDRTNNLLKHGNTSEGCHPLWSATWISAVSRGYLECVAKQRTAAGLQGSKHKKNDNDNSLLDLTFLLVLELR